MPTRKEPDIAALLEDLLARSGVRDRTSIEKHLAQCDAEPDNGHSKLWRRLAGKLGSLAPLPFRTSGAESVLFYVPDGKYRMQVFALEDKRDGVIQLYMPDILAEAIRAKLLSRDGTQYNCGAKGPAIQVDSLDSENTPDPAQHVKHMIGWNRKAIRITIGASDPDSPQVKVAEGLCALAAKQWENVPMPAAP